MRISYQSKLINGECTGFIFVSTRTHHRCVEASMRYTAGPHVQITECGGHDWYCEGLRVDGGLEQCCTTPLFIRQVCGNFACTTLLSTKQICHSGRVVPWTYWSKFVVPREPEGLTQGVANVIHNNGCNLEVV